MDDDGLERELRELYAHDPIPVWLARVLELFIAIRLPPFWRGGSRSFW